jgi:hypothetical protein
MPRRKKQVAKDEATPISKPDAQVDEKIKEMAKEMPPEQVVEKILQPEQIFLTEEEQNLYNNFIYTLKNLKDTDKDLGISVISYIIRQINNESLMTNINLGQFEDILKRSLRGLFKLVYLQYWTTDLLARDSLFASSRIFLTMMFLRTLDGRHYLFKLEVERNKARPIIAGQTAQVV